MALAKNGDCWASATNAKGVATLTYFKACSGSGKAAGGYRNQKLYVYKCCNPKCSLVGGPFTLKGEATSAS